MKTLIVDCGATKADWRASDGTAFRTPGINLAHMPPEQLRPILDGAAARLGGGIGKVFFYAAGLVESSPVDLHTWFPEAEIEYASDILAAARAVCGRESGIAAILGTGANTCQYDGNAIVKKVNCGGFIVGDEGSASVLGRLFITDYLKGFVPAEVADAFSQRFQSSYPEIVRNIYGAPAPARYLGSIAPFLLEHYANSYVKDLVDNNFRLFFERTVLQYDALPVGVVGGFGYACREILQRIGLEYGVRFRAFLHSPMDGLVKYYGL